MGDPDLLERIADRYCREAISKSSSIPCPPTCRRSSSTAQSTSSHARCYLIEIIAFKANDEDSDADQVEFSAEFGVQKPPRSFWRKRNCS